jgi:hypothetical protein
MIGRRTAVHLGAMTDRPRVPGGALRRSSRQGSLWTLRSALVVSGERDAASMSTRCRGAWQPDGEIESLIARAGDTLASTELL